MAGSRYFIKSFVCCTFASFAGVANLAGVASAQTNPSTPSAPVAASGARTDATSAPVAASGPPVAAGSAQSSAAPPGASAGAAQAPGPTQETPVGEMDLYRMYAEASKLHEAGQFDQAYERYARIWNQKRGYDVAASMGDIELRREHYALAAGHFRYALDHMPVTQNKLYLATLQEGFDKARPFVAEVRLTAHPAVAGLQVSNALTGEQYTQPFYLSPGHHTLKVMAPNYRVVLQEVTAARAATIELDVYLTPVLAPAGKIVEADLERTVKRRHPEIVFPIGGAVTLGLAAAATWSFWSAGDAHEDLQSLNVGSSECLNPTSSRCRRADDLAEKTENRQTLGWALTGGAVLAAGATGLVYWLWETDVPLEVNYKTNNQEFSVRWSHVF